MTPYLLTLVPVLVVRTDLLDYISDMNGWGGELTFFEGFLHEFQAVEPSVPLTPRLHSIPMS